MFYEFHVQLKLIAKSFLAIEDYMSTYYLIFVLGAHLVPGNHFTEQEPEGLDSGSWDDGTRGWRAFVWCLARVAKSTTPRILARTDFGIPAVHEDHMGSQAVVLVSEGM